jgi:hypothetical protein
MKTKIFTLLTALAISTYAMAQIIHVPGDESTIQAGIDAAEDGATVLVEHGTYYENINFTGKAITVASHYLVEQDSAHIYNTIIDGSQPVNPEIGTVVTFNSGEDTTSVLRGFTIRNGTGTYITGLAHIGGGIDLAYSGGTVKNNIIENNSINSDLWSMGAGLCQGPPGDYWIVVDSNIFRNNSINSIDIAYGGGIYAGCNTVFRYNQVYNNSAYSDNENCGPGGILINSYGGPPQELFMEYNIIKDNIALSTNKLPEGGIAGGLGVGASYGVVRNNTIENNQVSAYNTCYGPGVLLEFTNTNLVFENNIVANNSFQNGYCKGGAICILLGNATVQNNMIYNNTASRGAGIYHEMGQGGHSLIINNTITQNTAEISGGGIYLEDATAWVMNTILWNNDAPYDEEISIDYGTISISYSDISGGYDGIGNIDEDPLFEDPENFDFHLTSNSPCIDSGDPSLTNDPDETIRDIGAFYFDQRPVVALDATEITDTSFIASWEEAEGASSYLLDVAYDSDFNDFVGDYHKFNVGNVLSYIIDSLTPSTNYYYRIRANYYFGRSGYSNTIMASTITSIKEFENQLNNLQVYPNPITNNSCITFSIFETGFVDLYLVDLSGKKIEAIITEKMNPGHYHHKWYPDDLNPGVYFMRFQAEGITATKKIIIVN